MGVVINQTEKIYNVTVNQTLRQITANVINQPKQVTVTISALGARGFNGKSAYEVALDNGFIGTEQEWLDSLKTGGQVKIYQEIPIGLINGINATFNTEFNFTAGTIEVFLNGMMLKIIADYQVIGNNTFTLNISPTSNENLIINYIKQ